MTSEVFPQTGLLDQIHPLLEAPLFLSEEHARQNVLPVVMKTILAVTFIYMVAFPVACRIPQTNNSAAAIRRLTYQITNLITNSFIGLLGLYAQYHLLPENPTVKEKIQGSDQLAILGSIQIGFQVWSIFMGLFVVEESVAMLAHHGCVICASFKVTFMTNGFRYFAPLAFGMTELSSVPLAIMNAFKNNKSWIDARPQFYGCIRAVFAATFLFVRIYKFVPQHLEYLKLSFLVPYLAQDHDAWYRTYMFTNWIGACFLLYLQLYWGYLIVSGMLKFLFDNQVKVQRKKVD